MRIQLLSLFLMLVLVLTIVQAADPACRTAQACIDKCQSQGHQTGSCHNNFYRWKLEKRCKCYGEAMSVFKRVGKKLEKFGNNIFQFCKEHPQDCYKAGEALG